MVGDNNVKPSDKTNADIDKLFARTEELQHRITDETSEPERKRLMEQVQDLQVDLQVELTKHM